MSSSPGGMKRVASCSVSTRFRDLEELCSHLGATKKVQKLLIANNGLAAVKGIRSIRSWLYDHISDVEAIQMCVMASPEDLKANAEFVHMADQNVEVPGGSNRNNYANVELIVSTALQLGCDAVYPGWGHASENPALPRECDATRRVAFLGPSESAMFALGDKIASTIIAQSNGVPTVPWSGDAIRLEPGTFEIDPALYERSYVKSAAECEAACRRIGFPVMIKASEGGGGKGIRKVLRTEDVADCYRAVVEEVAGCHVFVMRMLENVRHLEVQLLADAYGHCIAVRTRDCSVQRRHQKIIEEGPVVGVSQSLVEEMEAAAIRLALAVGYKGLGTVEYMYDKDAETFFFLELNPRIQVEHPVSELISGVNLPAALLCVGMGVALDRIPEVRTFYGEQPYETTPIDFTKRASLPPRCHAIAVRITAEDVDEGFRPTTGAIDEIKFSNSKECWGYFSVGSGGAVHQFADSQFGHVFSTGETREDARRGMVMALKNVTVRGEIRTSTAYVLELLERQEFRDCDVNTQWLDGLIAKRMKELPSAQSVYPALLAAAVFRMRRFEESNVEKYVTFLQAGHTPSVDYLSNCLTETFVVHAQKYTVSVAKVNPSEYAVALNGSVVTVPFRVLNTGGMQLTVSGRTVVAYGEEEPTSLRVTIAGRSVNFTGDVDPTKLRSSVPGRLVRFLIPDGAVVQENAPYAEVEVMKMILPLRAAVSGIMQIRATAGCTVTIGKLLAEVLPEDPSSVKRPVDNCDPWPEAVLHPSNHVLERPDALQRARQGLDTLWSLTCGFHAPFMNLADRVTQSLTVLPSLSLSTLQLRALNRAYLDERYVSATTPVEKQKAVYACICDEYYRVEKLFDGCSRQEALAAIRDSSSSSHTGPGGETQPLTPLETFAADFAHHQEHRHEVLKALLTSMESNRQLMTSCSGILQKLSSLQSSSSSPQCSSVLLQARYLLRQCSLPSFEDRKSELAHELEVGNVETLMKGAYGFDLMCAVMYDARSPHLAPLAIELFVRRCHFGVNVVTNIDIYRLDTAWVASYHAGVLGDEHEPLVKLSSAEHGVGDDDDDDAGATVGRDPSSCQGFVAVFNEEQHAAQVLPAVLNMIERDTPLETSAVANVFLTARPESTQNHTAAQCAALLAQHKAAVMRTRLELVTFLVHGANGGPHIFTFRRRSDFKEDALYRNLVPTSARRLELDRLCHYNITKHASLNRQVHIFYAVPIKKAGSAAASSPIEHRVFVRMFISPRDLHVHPWSCISDQDAGHAMSLCISSMEFARSDKKLAATAYNHLFIHLIELTVDVTTMTDFFRRLAGTYWRKLFALGVREAEIKFKVQTDAGFVPFRIHIIDHTGHALTLRCFVETVRRGEVFLKRMETKEDLESSSRHIRSSSLSDAGTYSGSEGSPTMPRRASAIALTALSHHPMRVAKTQEKLDALRKLLPSRKVEPFQAVAANDSFSRPSDPTGVKEEEHGEVHLDPYPIMPSKQIKRLQANSVRTTYVHDWILIFDVVLRQRWRELVTARGWSADVVPPRVLLPSQLYVDAKTKLLTLSCSDALPCGMIVWVLEFYPPSYYDPATSTATSRRVVVVANDITFQSGSFAVPEDLAFRLASDYARQEHLPFVYLSANSGARLGLCGRIKDRLRVALRGEDTLDYLYLTPADYEQLRASGVAMNVVRVVAPVEDGGRGAATVTEERYRLVDVIGSGDEYLGVENLQGSALIAGHMSLNYSTIPTISVATGRTVGIGAYLVRLGRRVVQTHNSPIILTGATALNRLLGKEVYSDNCQLGGNQIMVPNGVTHWEAKNDLAAAHTVMRWLDYVPEVSVLDACRPRKLTLPVFDPVDRDVTFVPGRDETYDPRFLVHGNPAAPGSLGMFDAGSWQESLSGWAKTVVVGRAALDGTPCGVILVETRITKKFDPADPADPTSTSSFVSQAGQVWFPDSARKTADALDDFHKERLPCFILANWRGFSGGMRDMYDEVLKFGASIVDNLRSYNAPVFIYIPPFGELRGGAWVVVDPIINHCGVVEMYADVTARGGILEPAGVVEIKFRDADVRELIRRNDALVAQLLAAGETTEARKRETSLLPLYNDIAVHFADLHDTPGRMKAKHCIVDVVPWRDARRVFALKLQRKLKEVDTASALLRAGFAPSLDECIEAIKDEFVASAGRQGSDAEQRRSTWQTSDRESIAFLESTACQTWMSRQVSLSAVRRLQDAMGAVSPDVLKSVVLSDPKLKLLLANENVS